jgi:hypothetical protein
MMPIIDVNAPSKNVSDANLDFRVGSLITKYHCRNIKLIPWADVLIPPDTSHIKYFITNIIRMTLQHTMMLNDANHLCHAHSRKLNQFVKFKGTGELAARLRLQNQTTLENVLNMQNKILKLFQKLQSITVALLK